MVLQDVLNAVMGETGFQVPPAYVGSSNPDDAQMVFLANRAASFLREEGFYRLHKTLEIPLTAATEYDLPSDFLAYVPDTAYINGRVDPIDLPTSPDFWAYLKSSSGPSGLIYRARLLAGKLHIHNPQPSDTLRFEYVSNAPILDANGTDFKQRFTSDADQWLLDDDLLILEVKWRFGKAKGLDDWQKDEQMAMRHRSAVRARDAGSQTLGYAETERTTGEPYTNQ